MSQDYQSLALGGVGAIFLLERQFLRMHDFSDGENADYRNPEVEGAVDGKGHGRH